MTSTIKVNNIQNQCGQNIINENSNTITLGASGDTIALAAGASQSGFGRTGTVDWQTTPKTGDFTAANGEGYFVNTTSGEITMTMPSGSAGAIVSIQDYNKTFDSNNFTITPASGEKINGGTASAGLTINTEGQGLTFVYVDATVGWKTVHENEFTAGGSAFITATGGTITTCGNDKIHTFTGPGTFTVSSTSACAANNTFSYVVVGGGGGGGSWAGGGGGAGGYREVKSPATPYTASPLDGYSTPGNRIAAASQAYPITVGAGGTAPPSYPTRNCGTNGSVSTFSTISGAGGGKGGNQSYSGANGGSGGGQSVVCSSVGSGNTPPTTPPQGNDGGGGHSTPPIGAYFGGGGGGATAAGTGDPGGNDAGPGGAGATSSITGSPVARAGGGGGGNVDTGCSTGGAGGGGAGGGGDAGGAGVAGTANTGGGGGSAGAASPSGATASPGGAGGSGIVIIRYKFQ